MVLGAEVLDDVGLDAQPRQLRVGRRAVLEVGRPDAEDQRAPGRPPPATTPAASKLKSANETRPFATSASTRFIDGEPMNAATKRFAGLVEEVLRRVDLLQQAVPEHRDPLPERHRLDLVVRHVDGRHAEPLVQLRELRAHRHAQLRVEVRERLVHQERLRLAHDRPAHRDALALAARERRRLAVEQLVEPERLRDLVDAPAATPPSAASAA